MKKKTVAVLFGGRSAEHEVSLQSAKSIVEAIDKKKYDVVLIGITKEGKWLINDESKYLLHADNPKLIQLNQSNRNIALQPGNSSQLVESKGLREIKSIDVVFPVMHGTYGEDGAIQGFLNIMDIAFVGPDILGSAVGMDKDVMKRLLRDAGIPIGKFISLQKNKKITFKDAQKQLGLPMFVKPANLGSSVGVSKVTDLESFSQGVAEAFMYDTKIIIEEFIKGREIEVAVLGNDEPIASVPGEVIPHHDFYSYESKYIDEDGAGLQIPAKIPVKVQKEIQKNAIKTFTTLCCQGMGRVDCFLTDDNKVYVNEINTIPGFTKISMYPKLWEATGLTYTELLDRLITLALAHHADKKKLKTSFV